MLFALGSALILFVLVAVRAIGRVVNRPGAPEWLRRAALGNVLALVATLVFAVGMSLLLQAAFLRGDLLGLVLAIVGFVAPLMGFWLVTRALARREMPASPQTVAEPVAAGPARRGRPDARPAPAAGGAAGLRRAG